MSFQNFINKIGRSHLIYAQVRKDGKIIEDWSRFASKPRFESYSAAKTFAGIGVGIAIDEGLISLDEKIIDSFKEESYDVTNPYAYDITVRDMLTMSSGLSNTLFWKDGWERKHEQDWTRYFFKKGQFENKPGSTFLYNNANTYMLGRLIEKKSGQNLLEYLRYRLFEPLEFHNPEWLHCPMGHTVAANSLMINVDEMGNLGQMLCNGGVYKNKRIVSKAFVKDMMTQHIEVPTETVPRYSNVKMGYGYFLWIDSMHKCGFLWGIWGQYCIVIPEKNIVIATQAFYDEDGGSNGEYKPSPMREILWQELVSEYC